MSGIALAGEKSDLKKPLGKVITNEPNNPNKSLSLNLFTIFREGLFFAHVISNTKFNKK